jgi:hypothetical protein
MLVAEATLNEVAAVPPKLTAVAPVRLVPVMVTVAPEVAVVGLNDAMVGVAIGRLNVNPAKEAAPPDVVTLTLPDAPAPTTAVMLVAEATLNEVAAVPPKLTAVAPVRLVPVMVTVAPEAAVVGVNDAIAGVGVAGVSGSSLPQPDIIKVKAIQIGSIMNVFIVFSLVVCITRYFIF